MSNAPNAADRRGFIGATIGLTLGAIAADALRGKAALAATDASVDLTTSSFAASHGMPARQVAYQLRVEVARQNRDATPVDLSHPTNCDEARYANKIGSFS